MINKNDNETNKDNKTKKVGRPKKKPVEVPPFKDDKEIRKFLTNLALQITLQMTDDAMKGNNIKNQTNAKIKIARYKSVLDGIKVVNNLLKDKQADDIQSTIDFMETTSYLISNDETISSEPKKEISKLMNLLKTKQELLE